jgi:hypothetical protein
MLEIKACEKKYVSITSGERYGQDDKNNKYN